jgi:tetratricopeptide (TPR) repeat protein
MAGVGKSYLVDRFFWEHADRFPGGYLRLALDPDKPASAADLVVTLRDRLKLPAGDGAVLVPRLLTPLTLLHIENADSFDAGRVVGELAGQLPGCALVVSARFRRLGTDAGWPEVPLVPFDEQIALEQLRAELGENAPSQESWPALVAALGFLPLALHLAAGHLRADHRADAFLRRLRAKNLALTGADPADPTFRHRSRALLSDTFELSLAALRREGGAQGDNWLAGLSALGHAPAAGFGESLGAAISGLSAEAFEDMALAASRLSLLDRVPRGAESAFRLHPLLAELVRSRADKDMAFARITEWFVARLPEGGEDQGRRWHEINQEIAALTAWLAQIPPSDRVCVERAGSGYAMTNGPFHGWLRFCEEALLRETSDKDRSNFLWTLGNVARWGGLLDRALDAAKKKYELDRGHGDKRETALAVSLVADILAQRGQLDDALRIRIEEQLPVFEQLGDIRSRAITVRQIADIQQARGQLDDALKIRKEEELPAFERLGDVREHAVTMGLIADILKARGQFDQALKIHYEEQLPVYERLGDVRERAMTMGRIADILQVRGQLGEALKIRNEDELPVYERLGDVRERAVTMGKIADILQVRGQLEEALKIRYEEQLPVYERLGDVRARAMTMGRIADILQVSGQIDEALKIRNEDELPVYERLGDVHERAMTMGRIADILQVSGQLDEALKIRNEDELPVYEWLGDVRERAVTMGKIADILQVRGQLEEALKIHYEEQLPVYQRLGDVRERVMTMGRIADILQASGQLDQALKIWHEEVLPIFLRLGDVHCLLIGRWNLASKLLRRGRQQDRDEARNLLRRALDEARQLQLPEAQRIEQLLDQMAPHGKKC